MKNVIFDLGAVMFEWNPHKIAARFTNNPQLQQKIRDEVFFHADWMAFDCAHITEQQAIARASERTELSLAETQRLFDLVRESLVLIEPTHALLKRVKQNNMRAYCLSNISPELFAHLADRHDLFELFDGIVTSGQEKTGKPDKRIFEILLERYQLEPQYSLFIDDSPHNTATAQSLGLRTVTFKGSTACYQQIDTCLPELQ